MNLEDLRLFGAVAEARSFSAAARALDMPKGTLSRRIAGFERSLGVQLIHRTTRRLSLSEAGQRLLHRAAPLLEELQLLGDEIQSLQREPQGSLRVQVPAELLTEDLARLLAAFAADYPGITVQCTHYVRAALADPEQFDLTLMGYEWRLPVSDWIAVPFLSLRQGVFAAPGLGPQRIVSLPQLQALPALLPVDEPLWHFRVGANVETIAMTGALQLDSPSLRLRAAEEGGGIVKVPVLLADAAVRAGRLLPLDLPHQPVALSVALFYRSRVLPARVRVFIDYLQSNLIRSAVLFGGGDAA
jgi:DNA-binding transcriptional LysR family regulator